MNTLHKTHIKETLNTLHALSIADAKVRLEEEARSGIRQSRVNALMSVTAQEGTLLYLLAKTAKAQNIIEYGCSFGVSTIYLAAAAEDNDGHVTSTEFEPNKVVAAKENLRKVNLQERVTILEGDASLTLKVVQHEIDFLFLDGAKEQYLAIFKMLEPYLHEGSVVVADNVDKEKCLPFLEYMKGHTEKYTSSILFEGRLLVTYVH